MPFLFLGASFLSLWVRRDPKIWGTLLALSLISGLVAGNILWVGLLLILGLYLSWLFRIVIFILLLSLGLTLGFFPGFQPLWITPHFALGFASLIGLFPLAFLVPLARTAQDWKKVLRGALFGCAGIGAMALLALLSGVVQWDFKLPSFMAMRASSNLILTAIPEEGFYRGWIQAGLCSYFHKVRYGNALSLLLTSALFTAGHLVWSPDLGVLGFVFLASLLYGGVYLISNKIESAILCHFLLNLVHMTCFSYHAM